MLMNLSPRDQIKQAQRVSQQASRPQHNATIRASAGTGKTFLLVTRLARLLLSGTEPAGLLAITFTNKAAAEMQQRLQLRLLEWLQADDATLQQQLEEIGVTANPETMQRARLLHEQLLRNDRQPRITTFHAFCQDILRRFPLEADVPPGFALLESTGLLSQQAWDGLWYDVTQDTGSHLAAAVQQLLTACGGIDSCRKALFDFLGHRSDWWAYTQADNDTNVDPADWASQQLRQQLAIENEDDPSLDFFTAERVEGLQGYHDLLLLHDNASNRKMVAHIATIVQTLKQPSADHAALLQQSIDICFTKNGEPRAMKESKARAKAMGEAGQQRFLQLYTELKTALDQAIDRQRRLQTWRLSTAWYQAGQHLLEGFQKLKQEQRLLDFTDLEWRACRLLNDGDHSHWIQYKLDQRINHILIDEFQDTNPTQWQLLLPLLQELAAHAEDPQQRSRSIFLVGDEKQSIYRFRRADPRLFDSARDWLSQHLGATEYPLAVSWRSSPAIIDVVNRVFSGNDVTGPRLPDFPTHDTHRQGLSGQVEMLPLIPYPEKDNANDNTRHSAAAALRNPLLQPRVLAVKEQHLAEGRQIAQHIQALIDSDTSLRYADIMILLRNRTHLHDLEQALREAGIPYLGNGKKTLLDTLEIQDMVALLQVLISPANNLALAQVLRSPLFACSDDELVQIALQHRRQLKDPDSAGSDWMTALLQLAAAEDSHGNNNPALRRAAHWLPQWQRLAQQLPVHDLLDRIYSEANVEACFRSAFPAHLRPRVQANLVRFIELALAIDSGRYPSLPAFLNQLLRLQQHAPEHLSQANPDIEQDDNNSNDAIQILTIHSAKGLEARVVYLSDSGYKKPTANAWQALVDWPSQANRPASFLLTGRRQNLDDWSRAQLDADNEAEQREDNNLLYVALTRAAQQLIISGCADRGEQQGWYQLIQASFTDKEKETDGRRILSRHGDHGSANRIEPVSTETTATVLADISADIPAALSQPWSNDTASTGESTLHPSHSNAEAGDPLAAEDSEDANHDGHDGRRRGIAIHRLLELCTAANNMELGLEQAIQQLCHEQDIDLTQAQAWGQEVQALLQHPDLQPYFDPSHYHRALNEVPLHYRHQGRFVHGVIDRLLFTPDHIIVIDYKTHHEANDSNIKALASAYEEQMQHYAEGIRQLWPDKKISSLLLFTACAKTIIVV